jgi:hypothetical protein
MDKNWTRGMAQAVKYVLCNPEALSSSPSATKKKKKGIYADYATWDGRKDCCAILRTILVTHIKEKIYNLPLSQNTTHMC